MEVARRTAVYTATKAAILKPPTNKKEGKERKKTKGEQGYTYPSRTGSVKGSISIATTHLILAHAHRPRHLRVVVLEVVDGLDEALVGVARDGHHVRHLGLDEAPP